MSFSVCFFNMEHAGSTPFLLFLPLLFSVDLLRQPFPPGSHLVQKASPDFSRQLGTSSSLFPQDLVHIMILYLLLDDYKYLCLYSVSPTKL